MVPNGQVQRIKQRIRALPPKLEPKSPTSRFAAAVLAVLNACSQPAVASGVSPASDLPEFLRRLSPRLLVVRTVLDGMPLVCSKASLLRNL